MADDQAWAQHFLLQDDLTPIVAVLMRRDRYTPERASRLARYAANARFMVGCLENVREGLMILDEVDGAPTFILTPEGARMVEAERDETTAAIAGQPPEDLDERVVQLHAKLARLAVAPEAS